MKIYVGNLSYNANREELRVLFRAYGEAKSVQIVRHHDSGKLEASALVEMASTDAAQAAIFGLHGTEFKGRQLVVAEAHPCPKT